MAFGIKSEILEHSMGLFDELYRPDSGTVERCISVVSSFVGEQSFGQYRYPAYFYSVLFSIITGHSLCMTLEDSFGNVCDAEDAARVFDTAKKEFKSFNEECANLCITALEKFVETYSGYKNTKISYYGVAEVQTAKEAIRAYKLWLGKGTMPITTDIYAVRYSCMYSLQRTILHNKRYPLGVVKYCKKHSGDTKVLLLYKNGKNFYPFVLGETPMLSEKNKSLVFGYASKFAEQLISNKEYRLSNYCDKSNIRKDISILGTYNLGPYLVFKEEEECISISFVIEGEAELWSTIRLDKQCFFNGKMVIVYIDNEWKSNKYFIDVATKLLGIAISKINEDYTGVMMDRLYVYLYSNTNSFGIGNSISTNVYYDDVTRELSGVYQDGLDHCTCVWTLS